MFIGIFGGIVGFLASLAVIDISLELTKIRKLLEARIKSDGRI